MGALLYESGDLNVHVSPILYRLKLAPTPESTKGSVTIELDIHEGFAGHSITLHADPLMTIHSAQFVTADAPQKTYALVDTQADEHFQTRTLNFATEEGASLPIGKALLTIDFTSVVHSQETGYGVYQVKFDDGTIGYTTQFEPVGAREAFPCFDEPAIRAIFELELELPSGTKAIANTPIESVQEQNDKSITKFGPTMKMSSYLLCFAVGPFVSLERKIEITDQCETRELLVTAWSLPTDLKNMEQVLSWGCNAVAYFTKTFRCFLPLTKLDLVGVPLKGLGMENFGILTFRTTHFLINEETELALRKRICLLILHEVSHLWFGDMVTVRWWKYLYLKEGFARLLEYTVANVLYPEFNWWEHFLTNHYHQTRMLDARPERVHPVEVPIHRAKDSEDIFDFISYGKGASVLRMTSAFIGADAFFSALPILINKFKYQSITTDDLWACFQQTSGQDVGRIMDVWVKQNGHPTVTFTAQPPSDPVADTDIQLTLTQELHCLGLSAPVSDYCTDEAGQVCYPIPLVEFTVYPASEGTSFAVAESLYAHSKSVTINVPTGRASEAIILVNGDHRGFFAVSYSVEQWQRIATSLHRFTDSEVLGLLIEASQSVTDAEVVSLLKANAAERQNLDIATFLSRFYPIGV